jgi:acyl-CoA reductase-like NAD-dependent aldehyde dehydrogenase
MADKVQGDVIPVEAGFLNYVEREPLGVVGSIVPWNFPLMFCSWKLGPALAAGNTVVMKPSELTPMTSLRLAQLVSEVGFPPGTVNIVPGYGPADRGAPEDRQGRVHRLDRRRAPDRRGFGWQSQACPT